MTLHERLLRLVLDPDKATALLGDLEEDAAREHAGRSWLRRQALRHTMTAARFAARQRTRRMLMTMTLAFRDARRSIWRFRGTSILAIAILTLSLAAGAVTFAVVDGIVLRPLPYADSERVVSIFGITRTGPQPLVSPADYYAWRSQVQSLEAVAAAQVWPFQPTDDPQAERISMVVTTASLFDVLRTGPLFGTRFTGEHEAQGRDNVALISHGLWQRRFGGDPSVIGQRVATPTGPATVIGVMPPDFAYPVEAPAPAAIWRPLAVPPEQRVLSAEGGRASYLHVIGRLKDGVDLQQARADVERVSGALAAEFPQLYPDWRPRTERTIDALTEGVAGWMRLVLAAVALLIVIGCANVSNLLLTRSASRAKAISIRASLGATRGHVIASLLVESLLLSAAAVAGGLLASYWLLAAVKAALPPGIPRADLLALDGRVLAAAAAACVVTAVIAGLVPAWQSARVSSAEILKETAGGTPSRSRRAWQGSFLIVQVALVVVLLVATSLLVGSFARVLRVDLGFERQNLLGVRLRPALPAGPERAAPWRDFHARALDAVRGVPGVSAVATFTGAQLPLYRGGTTARITARGSSAPEVSADMRRISEGYLETAGIRLLNGRSFTEGDRAQDRVIIDDLAAQHFFGGDALNRHISLPGGKQLQIVGVAANVRVFGPEGVTQPQIYRTMDEDFGPRVLMIRTSMPPAAVAPAVKAALETVLPPKSPRVTVDVVEDQFRLLTAERRFTAGMMSGLGILALVIGIGGVYATTGTMVAQRTKEIGIRMALGASAGRVVQSVTAATARLLLTGSVIGMGTAWAVSGVFQSILFGLDATDLLAYAVPFVVIGISGGIAALLPARRAARIDPLIALRTE
jgi:putative ABC transport system permease protein